MEDEGEEGAVMWVVSPDDPWPSRAVYWPQSVALGPEISVGELVRKGVVQFRMQTLLHPTVVFFGRAAWEKVKEENYRAMQCVAKETAFSEYMGMRVAWLADEGIMLAYSPQFDPTKAQGGPDSGI